MKSITIQDIAREAGVGKSTVSRVINNSGYVSQEAETRVRYVMEKYQYQPNAAAQSLSRMESDTVGLILPEIDNPFFSGILLGVTRMVELHGYTLVLSSSGNDAERDLRAIAAMNRQRVCGLLYVPACDYADETQFSRLERELSQLSCPVVLLDRSLRQLSLDSVQTDNFGGAYDCTQALIDAGHRRIGIVAGDMDLSIGRERYQGFAAALERNRLKMLDKDVIHGQFDQRIAYERVREVLNGKDYPTAFFLCNNLSEAGFLKAVYERGLRIPEDIAFTAFDKLSNQDVLGLPFSFLERNIQEMGEQGARLLFRRLDQPKKETERIVIPSKVVLQGSEKKV